MYPLCFYTNHFIPATAAGCARGPVVFIRPEYRDDVGLYRHEMTHVKQSFIGLFIVHALLYLFYKPYRLWAEVEAYKEQAKHYEDDRRPLFAKFIAESYGLDVTAEQALEMLR